MQIEPTVSLVLEFLAAWFVLSLVLVTLFAIAGSRLSQRRTFGTGSASTAAAPAQPQGRREESLALIA